jgi:hypothetical protein
LVALNSRRIAMGFIEAEKDCSVCGRPTTHRQARPNHVLHFLLSISTCGLWLFGWLVAAMGIQRPWFCSACGTAIFAKDSGPALGLGCVSGIVLLIFFGLAAFVSFLGYMTR